MKGTQVEGWKYEGSNPSTELILGTFFFIELADAMSIAFGFISWLVWCYDSMTE